MINKLLGLNISSKPKLSETDLLLVLDGDSLTQGIGGNNNQDISKALITKLTPLCKSLEVYSFGVSGQSTLDMLSDVATQVDPLYNPDKTCVYIHWEDVNAILNEGRTAQENFDDHETLSSGRKAAGFDYTIHVTGYYPRTPYNQAGWNSGDPTPLSIQKDYFNLGKVPSADVLIDLKLNTSVGGAENQAIDPLKFDDSVHLLNSGYINVANDESGASYYLGIRQIFDL